MRCFPLFLFAFFSCNALFPQDRTDVLKEMKKADIPFEYKNDLIIVDVLFNRTFPLKFIFDTGAENTILAKKKITDLLHVPYDRTFKLLGADLSTELTAYLVRDIHLELPGATIPRIPMLVLEDDYFRFEEMAGLQIHGILGADIFRGLVVKINYERKVITLTKPSHFSPPEGYAKLPIQVHKNKAYLTTTLSITPGTSQQVKLLLDSGAMLSLLLNTNTHGNLKLPPDVLTGNVGTGLGGFIEGYLGRVAYLDVGDLQCQEILTNFQELPVGMDTSVLNGRNGLLGNKVLSRFHLVIDYPNEVLYFQPNKQFGQKDEFDKSGLSIIAADVRLNKYLVHSTLPGSPAEAAGMMPGDEILKLNHLPVGFHGLSGLSRCLRSKEGREVRMVVKREGQRLKFKFRLRRLI